MGQGFWSKEVEEEVNKLGILNHSPLIPEEVRKVFVTAHEIDPVWHIRTQMAFQKYTENAVSKTINLKHDAKAEEVKQAYLLAWDLGCKGITIFRDGSKETQVLNLGLKNKEEKGDGVIPGESLLTRPFVVSGSTYRLVTPVGNAFITINEDESHMPLELFINVGKAGSDVQAMAEALGRTISTSLRLRSSLNPRERAREIAEQLSGIGGRRSVGFGPNKIRSLPDAISVALSQHYHFNVNGNGHSEIEATPGMTGATLAASFPAPNGVVKSDPLAASVIPAVAAKEKMGDLCPSCGSGSLVYEEGCSKCHACGYSEC
jgi:ribonucleoside-diphosphate reductase alpha chain